MPSLFASATYGFPEVRVILLRSFRRTSAVLLVLVVVGLTSMSGHAGGGIASVSIEKSAFPNPVPAGTNLLYVIRVSVSETAPADSVTLSDLLPSGTTFVSLTPPVSPAGWVATTPPVGTNGLVTVTNASVGALTISQFQLIVNVDAATPAGSTISNTATVTWAPVVGLTSLTLPSASATATVTVSAAVPTLGQWPLLALGAVLLGLGAWTLERRRRRLA